MSWQADVVDRDLKADDRQQRGRNLERQLEYGPDPTEIVEDHQGGDDGGREQHPQGLWIGGEECRCQAETEVERQPPEARGRPAVDPPFAWLGDRPQPEGEPARRQHDDRGADEGNG